MRVAYFGPAATFTHQAAVRHFGRAALFVPRDGIAGVFEEVEAGGADYGVVPVENSTEGAVNHTLDMFMESDLAIRAEREDPIRLCLLSDAKSLKDVREVRSHSNPLGQSRRWLRRRLPGVPLREAASTAQAAAYAAKHPGVAAIASPLAAELYGLKVLAPGIQDAKHNRTRFLIIGRGGPEPPTGRDKTSLLLSIKDRVGALYDLLGVFKREGLNLTKIESRPTKKKAWEYVFFIDLAGHAADAAVKRALSRLKDHCQVVKVLGSYPRAD